VRLTKLKAAEDAVKLADREPNNRLVVYLAPTGGGKSTLAHRLGELYPGGVVLAEATEPWRRSYFAAARDLARAAGVKEDLNGATQAQDALIEHLRTTRQRVVIDEAHYLGPSTLNLLKAILNLTPSTVIVLAIPELWKRMESAAWKEAEQLKRRTAAKIEVPGLTAPDVGVFLKDRLPGCESAKDWKGIVADCLEAANRFGLLDTLERVSDLVREQAPKEFTIDLFTTAIAEVDALRS
jgi:type II secretory pathway predicted ATPase ExeA